MIKSLFKLSIFSYFFLAPITTFQKYIYRSENVAHEDLHKDCTFENVPFRELGMQVFPDLGGPNQSLFPVHQQRNSPEAAHCKELSSSESNI